MSGLSDIIDFKLFEGKKIWDTVRKKPSRLLTGVDPASTGLWNKVKGSDDKAIVDQWGGTTKENMDAMDKAGINTGPGRATEGMAHAIAAYFAMSGLAGAGGGASGSGANATNPALAESAVGTPGYGASSAGPGGMGAGGGLSSGQNWMQMGKQFGKMGDQKPQQDITEVDMAALLAAQQREQQEQDQIALSSKKSKVPMGASRGGLSNGPIDQNGNTIAAIQELSKRVKDLKARIAKAKAKRSGAKGK